ncbi:MAG: hypothetical protein K5664_06610, partial [Firmicutes bacterium]|nr:hypothetical protein [Bacillota bacterium]
MNRQENTKTLIVAFACGIPIVVWLALICAGCYQDGNRLFDILERISIAFENPTRIVINEYSLKAVLIF